MFSIIAFNVQPISIVGQFVHLLVDLIVNGCIPGLKEECCPLLAYLFRIRLGCTRENFVKVEFLPINFKLVIRPVEQKIAKLTILPIFNFLNSPIYNDCQMHSAKV